MEWKIGEIKQIKGEWYQCVKGESEEKCTGCFFKSSPICIDLNCLGNERKDHTKVIFKKLEKVGGTYAHNSIIVQKYRIRTVPVIMPNEPYMYFNAIDNTIEIEIKQNKEDMEENKLNLKLFDIQKAREGKPVCTRDGRKARIICFDRNDLYPIVALIECEDGKEIIGAYSKEGQTEIYEIKGTNLMMLPEKKEGWVNLYKSSAHPTKEEAMKYRNKCDDYIDTIKISWEE